MKKTLQIAREANKIILSWAKHKEKLVVGIDGYTGIGKTTLTNNLAKLNREILIVNRDDFQISRASFRKLYKNADPKARVKLFELEMNDFKKLEKVVMAFRKSNKPFKFKAYDGVTGKVNMPKVYDFSKKIMVVEGVLMFHPKPLKHLWDKKIYLKGNIKKINKRRIKREKKRWGKDYFPETHPDSYFRQAILAFKNYQKQYKPDKSSDLIINVD